MKKTKTAALICEFNPLHTGHGYILSEMKRECNVICVMSGNYVQRGGPAIADKFVRAKCALAAGADLVIELPFPHAMGSAEYFASGAISVLDRLSCVDELWFGCECGDTERLSEIARNMLDEKYLSALLQLGSDEGYALSTQKIYAGLFGPCPELEAPNNLLAIEYIKAILRLNAKIKPVAIKRKGDFHSETLSKENFPSATAIRKAISSGDFPAEFMPQSTAKTLKTAEKAGLFPVSDNGNALLYALRSADEKKIPFAAGASGGLGNRICTRAEREERIIVAAWQKWGADMCGHLNGQFGFALYDTDAQELFSALSTKKFTDARIRRTVYNCLFGITEADLKSSPDYTQVLALNRTGREILSDIRKTSTVPVVTKPADVPAASRQSELTDLADAYFTLSLPRPRQSGFFKTLSPYVEENEE